MNGKARVVRFIQMQPQNVKFKYVQINMKQVSYVLFYDIIYCPQKVGDIGT